VNTIIIWYILW